MALGLPSELPPNDGRVERGEALSNRFQSRARSIQGRKRTRRPDGIYESSAEAADPTLHQAPHPRVFRVAQDTPFYGIHAQPLA